MEFLENSMENLDISTASHSKSWIDITSLCQQASLLLTDQTPLICTDSFSLFESMSAVELMDPKMDQCCGLVGSIEIKDLVNFDRNELLSFEIICEILQSLVICEVQFLNGASLLESVHQCKFSWPVSWTSLEASEDLPISALLCFSKSTHKCVWKVMRSVLEAGIYEEEDFQPQSRYNPVNDIDEDDAVIHHNIHEIIDLVQVCLISNNIESERHHAKTLIHGLLSFRDDSHKFYELIEVFITDCLRSHADHSMVDTNDYLSRLLPILELVNKIIDLLVSLESKNFKNVTPHTGNNAVAFAFDSSMSRSMQTTPLRHIPFTDFLSSITYLKTMFTEFHEECSHLQIFLKNPMNVLNYEHLLQLCISISQNHKHLLVRSFVWSTLHLLSPQIPSSLLMSMKTRGIPNCILDNETTRKWSTMIERTAWDTLSCFLSNRHRLLSRLDNLFRYWGAIVRDAGMIDNKLMELLEIDENSEKQQWVSTWALILVSSLYDAHMGVVVESHLLGKNELDYFYWYWDYILSSRVYATRRLNELQFTLANKKYENNRMEAMEALKALKKTKKEKDKSKRWSKAECQRILDEPPPAPFPPSIEELVTKAKGSLVKGLFRVYVALGSVGLLQKPDNPYTSWEFRFFNRFRAFQSIANPPVLDLEAFQQVAASSRDVSLTDICNASLHCFKTAKAILDEARRMEAASRGEDVYEWLMFAQVMQLSKVCVASSVCTLKLLKTLSDKAVPTTTTTTTTSSSTVNDNVASKSVAATGSSMVRVLLGEKERREAFLISPKKLQLTVDNTLHPHFFRPELKSLE